MKSLLQKISPVYHQVKGRPSAFAESHVSAQSFWENKHGPQLRTCQISLDVPSRFHQYRSFKTYRSGDIHMRNPTVIDRLRNKLTGNDPNRIALGSQDVTSKDIKGISS